MWWRMKALSVLINYLIDEAIYFVAGWKTRRDIRRADREQF